MAGLQTVFVIAYLAFAPLIGYLGDKLNRKYLIIIATLLEMTSVITGSFVQDSSKVNGFIQERTGVRLFDGNFARIPHGALQSQRPSLPGPQFIPIWRGLQNDTKIRTQLTGIDDIIIMTNEIITF